MTLKDNPSWIALTRGTIEARARAARATAPPLRTEPVTREVASALLTGAVQREIAAGGRVEHASDTTVVLAHGTRPNHVLHLLLSVFTFGLWLVVWVVLAATGAPSRVMLTVDPCGNVTRTPVAAGR